MERLVAEVLARAVTTPLEVASILMQALPLASSSSSSLAPLGLKSYHWTGVLLSCTRLVSHTAIKAGVWYEAQHQLRVARRKRRAAEASARSHRRHSAEASFMEWGRWWWLPVLTSSVASAGAVALSYPLTSLRVRLVAQLLRPEGPLYAGAWDALRRVYASEGIRGLYCGLVPLVLGAIVFDVVAFGGYRLLARAWSRSRPATKVEVDDDGGGDGGDGGGWLAHFCRGCLASMLALALSHPFELVSRRMVAERVLRASVGSSGGGGLESSLVALVRRIAAEEGLRAFFVGLWPLLLRIVPYAALTYAFHRLLFQWWSSRSAKGKYS